MLYLCISIKHNKYKKATWVFFSAISETFWVMSPQLRDTLFCYRYPSSPTLVWLVLLSLQGYIPCQWGTGKWNITGSSASPITGITSLHDKPSSALKTLSITTQVKTSAEKTYFSLATVKLSIKGRNKKFCLYPRLANTATEQAMEKVWVYTLYFIFHPK